LVDCVSQSTGRGRGPRGATIAKRRHLDLVSSVFVYPTAYLQSLFLSRTHLVERQRHARRRHLHAPRRHPSPSPSPPPKTGWTSGGGLVCLLLACWRCFCCCRRRRMMLLLPLVQSGVVGNPKCLRSIPPCGITLKRLWCDQLGGCDGSAQRAFCHENLTHTHTHERRRPLLVCVCVVACPLGLSARLSTSRREDSRARSRLLSVQFCLDARDLRARWCVNAHTHIDHRALGLTFRRCVDRSRCRI
jgi:hypothetical protein